MTTNSTSNRLLVTALFFVIFASLVYVLTGVAKLNVPRYYPLEDTWRMISVKDQPSMGYYGKIAVTLPLAILASVLFYFLLPLVTRSGDIAWPLYLGGAKYTLFLGLMFFVFEEWHSWSIAKAGLATQVFWGRELWTFLIGLAVLGALALGAGLTVKYAKK